MSQPKVEAHEAHLPLDRCRLYPGIPIRFELDVPGIGESIRRQGQQEPGMAIKWNSDYLIPEGRRRLLGCRYSRFLVRRVAVQHSFPVDALTISRMTSSMLSLILSVLICLRTP